VREVSKRHRLGHELKPSATRRTPGSRTSVLLGAGGRGRLLHDRAKCAQVPKSGATAAHQSTAFPQSFRPFASGRNARWDPRDALL
jgi:hypothetical protein